MDGYVRITPQSVGDHLREDFLPDYDLKAPTFAKRLGVDRQRVVRLLKGARCDADMALRLAAFFGTTPEFWMNLQSAYELGIAERDAGDKIRGEVEPPDSA
ncbi:MAG: HigA family addiction module antitoxin [Alphaproteobacteria bacterium]|nr:HigA family addiction module antitoxin [Alphaproteobacteria bacterium]